MTQRKAAPGLRDVQDGDSLFRYVFSSRANPGNADRRSVRPPPPHLSARPADTKRQPDVVPISRVSIAPGDPTPDTTLTPLATRTVRQRGVGFPPDLRSGLSLRLVRTAIKPYLSMTRRNFTITHKERIAADVQTQNEIAACTDRLCVASSRGTLHNCSSILCQPHRAPPEEATNLRAPWRSTDNPRCSMSIKDSRSRLG
jgi:hypothetical protein